MTREHNFTKFESSSAVNLHPPLCGAAIESGRGMRCWRRMDFSSMKIYASTGTDCDLALRMVRCGIVGVQLDIQYFHYGSASHRLAPNHKGSRDGLRC